MRRGLLPPGPPGVLLAGWLAGSAPPAAPPGPMPLSGARLAGGLLPSAPPSVLLAGWLAGIDGAATAPAGALVVTRAAGLVVRVRREVLT